ncbi:MAG: hypothetical protein KJP00_15215 [Bacteroidia bacterium]|nr:hypothetical protein [Bacteroidia bacterium]
MKDKDIYQDEFNDLPDLLKEMKGKTSFKIPNNYFNQMQDDVLGQIIKSPAPVSTQHSWLEQLLQNIQTYFQPKYVLAVAAIAALIVVSVGINQKSSVSDYEAVFAELSEEDYEYFLDTDLEELENQQLISVLTSSEVAAINYVPVSSDQVSEELMEEYIVEMDDETIISLENQ